jgi:hypothetical protein
MHQEFSNLMLSLFNAGTPGGGQAFSYGLRRARLDLIVGDTQFSRWFARAYAGEAPDGSVEQAGDNVNRQGQYYCAE